MKTKNQQANDLLKLVYIAIKNNPDLRLGQIICNALNITDSQLFHTTDSDLETKLLNWIKRDKAEHSF